jgi:hypothetical protein
MPCRKQKSRVSQCPTWSGIDLWYLALLGHSL